MSDYSIHYLKSSGDMECGTFLSGSSNSCSLACESGRGTNKRFSKILIIAKSNCQGLLVPARTENEYFHINWAVTGDFHQCGILTSVDSYEPVQPPFKLRNFNSVKSVT